MRYAAPLVLSALVLALTGCYVEEEPVAEAAPPPPPAATEEGPITGMANRGAGSSPGKAKQSAKNTVSAVEQRQAELEKQLEDDNN